VKKQSYTVPVYADDEDKAFEFQILNNQLFLMEALATRVDIDMSSRLQAMCRVTQVLINRMKE